MNSIRKLAAIMFTDIVGYTATMDKNESAAFKLLDKNRSIQKPLIEKHTGTFIKEIGDGIMASFNSALDAVECADDIQNRIQDNKEFTIRIGIHLGDVTFQDNDVFGDGVNIASRLEALAPPGSTYISETVFQNIKNKPELHAKFIREEKLKNVQQAIKIYQIGGGSITSNVPKHEKSIAVLPFINISNDADQEYFCDGMTEEIIADLSQLKNLLVISRSSIMTLKGTSKKISEISADLHARYILEGSVRKSGNDLRITAQLIDASNDSHIWAEKYNGSTNDIFDIQEKISHSIVTSLELKLNANEQRKLHEHQITNIEAYQLYLRARKELQTIYSPEGHKRAIEFLTESMKLNGESTLIYGSLASAYLGLLFGGARENKKEFQNKIQECIEKIFQLDDDSEYGYYAQGALAFIQGNQDTAVTNFKHALSFNKNIIEANIYLILIYLDVGRPEAAEPLINKLCELDPLSPIGHGLFGYKEWCLGRYNAALPYFIKSYEIDPNNGASAWSCACAYASVGMIEDSIKVIDKLPDQILQSIFGNLSLFLKYALQQDVKKALATVTKELTDAANQQPFISRDIAGYYGMIGHIDEALNWVEKAINIGYINYPFLAFHHPFYEPLREEPRFKELMDKIKPKWESFKI